MLLDVNEEAGSSETLPDTVNEESTSLEGAANEADVNSIIGTVCLASSDDISQLRQTVENNTIGKATVLLIKQIGIVCYKLLFYSESAGEFCGINFGKVAAYYFRSRRN